MLDNTSNFELFKLKREYFFYENPYKNKRNKIFNKRFFDWSNFKDSIYSFSNYQFNKLINNKNVICLIYYVKPAFNLNIRNISSLKPLNQKRKKGNYKILNFQYFNFKLNVDDLIQYFSIITNSIPFHQKKIIAKKILGADLLKINYKFNKISFSYLIQNKFEKRFFTLLFKRGLLTFIQRI